MRVRNKQTILFILLVCSTFQLSAQRGYHDAPYVRYEADVATLQNTSTLVQSFDQSLVQSEASEGVCVRMNASNSSAEWTMVEAVDGMVVRFSIPDGSSATLEMFVDGVYRQDINLSSHWAWQYLSTDPNPNNAYVSNDNPKMRFDETRLSFSLVNAGQTIMLRRKSGDVYLDFIEVEKLPVVVAALSGDRVYNGNGSDLQNFIDVNGGRTIYLPPGIYYVDRELYFGQNDTKLKGAGSWYTQIHFTNRNYLEGGIRANAYGVGLYGVYLTTDNNSRSNSYKGINGVYTQASVIEDVWVEHFETGAWIAQYNNGPAFADGFTMTRCRFRNNYADGVNLSKGTSNVVVSYCNFRNNGDDATAMWSHNNAECRNNLIEYCTIENTWRAAGCALYGGYNNAWRHIVVKDNLEVGLRVNNNFNGAYFNSEGMHEFEDIEVVRCGTQNDLFNGRVGAVDLKCSDVAGTRVQNVTFKNISLTDNKNDAIYFKKTAGEGFYNLKFENIAINGTGLEYPSNNINNDNEPRGLGVHMDGEPEGYSTYCNITFANRGGNATGWEDLSGKGGLSWEAASGCGSASVELLEPNDKSVFNTCQDHIQLKANASATTGNVEFVEFWIDGESAGKDYTAPYSVEVLNPGNGIYQVAAIAHVAGLEYVSNTAEVFVNGVIQETMTVPVIDGEVESLWNDFESQHLDQQLWNGVGIQGVFDLKAFFKMTMDQEYLYVLVNVTDDALFADSPGNENWNDDKVELYIDYGNNKYAAFGDDDHFYGFVHSDQTFYYGPGSATRASFSEGEKPGGYIIEARIPWNTLGGLPQYGDYIGVNVMVNDDDDGNGRESKIAWRDLSDMSWSNPSLFGTMQILPFVHQDLYVCSGETAEYPDGTVDVNVVDNDVHLSYLTGSNGCDSVVLSEVDLLNENITLFQVGSFIESTVNGADEYQWLDCQENQAPMAGEESATFRLERPGSYALYVNNKGCEATSDCFNYALVGLNEVTSQSFQLYPNPANGYVQLESEIYGIYTIQLISQLGEVLKEEIIQGKSRIETSDLEAGIYFLRFIDVSGQNCTKQFEVLR